MSDTTTHQQFEIVRRGYEPQQVDRRVKALVSELEATRRRTAELERRVEELHLQSRALQEQTDEGKPPYAGLGARIEQILGLAEEESKELRAAAIEEAQQHRALSEQAADKLRSEAERYAQERRSEADAEAARVLEDARRQADQVRDDTERDAKARREEAEAIFERNRAKAAQAAADFETTLAHRREQAEKDFTEQLNANEQQLSVVKQRSEQMRLEAEKLRADADRKSKRILDEAQRQADDLLADAKASAERTRAESERELAAATQRRDSINAQLTNVRQMLATLTGATLPNPLGDDEPAKPAGKGAPEQAAPPAAGKGEPGAGHVKPTDQEKPANQGPGNEAKAAGDNGSAAPAQPGRPAAKETADKPNG